VIADLKIAIQQYKKVLDITPVDYPNRVNRLQYLGTADTKEQE
jgi:predicted TPR repeat methyltransferase